MADLKYTPVRHDHDQFLAKARDREGFAEAYDSLELEYQVVHQLLKTSDGDQAARTSASKR